MATPDGVDPAPDRETTDQELAWHTVPESSGPPVEMVAPSDYPELVFALACTLGADWRVVRQQLVSELEACGYDLRLVRLSDQIPNTRSYKNDAERYEALMDAGDRFRQDRKLPGAVAIAAIKKIREIRDPQSPIAFLLDKLVHPDEVEILRAAYGSRLFVIACDSPRSTRLKDIQARFMESGLNADDAAQAAAHAINRDAGQALSKRKKFRAISDKYRVSVGKTLEKADVFVRGDSPEKTREIITRLVQCIFGHPFHTPTLDELGMALAYQAALTSASLSRRVGASIMMGEQIVAVGSNEVPKAGGGTYHEESWKAGRDARDFQLGRDPSDRIRLDMLADLLQGLLGASWKVPRSKRDMPLRKLAVEVANELQGCKLLDVIEYTRTTHAEMVAITAAARRGISIQGATVFTTTLPCHECTRNIIASGIGRVVYLEPYPKSKGSELQSDSIYLEAHSREECQDKLAFEPFSGFVYWRFAELFSLPSRKVDDLRKKQGKLLQYDGESVVWKARGASIRSSIFHPTYGPAGLVTQFLIENALIANLDRPSDDK